MTSHRAPRIAAAPSTRTLFLAGALLAGITVSALAQKNVRPDDLKGSKASVEKMYDFAVSHRMPFYLTPTNVDLAVEKGRLVQLTGSDTYELTRGVGFSYATREAKRFVEALAPQYLNACGAPLTVTSAARPKSRQPHNANPHSVHPTGIAVDLRRPPPGPCLLWIRTALTELEARGIVEATEERHPIHLHIAVLVAPGRPVVLPALGQSVLALYGPASRQQAVTQVSAGDVALPPLPAGASAYVVRQGDTMWDIANRHGVTVDAIKKANGKAARTLKPGSTLIIPAPSAK